MARASDLGPVAHQPLFDQLVEVVELPGQNRIVPSLEPVISWRPSALQHPRRRVRCC